MQDLQKQIIQELHVLPTIDPAEEVRKSVEFLKEYAKKHSFVKGFVIAISGGQDSTLAGKLVQMAVDELNEELGEDIYTCYAVRLPYGIQKDEQDAQDALDFIQPSKILTVNIKKAVDASVEALKNVGIEITDYVKGNEKARERMKAQYSIAAMTNSVVVGTDHAAEAITGFYTKYGDGGVDLNPLARLNKRQGRQILAYLGCPEHLYMKTPTADLEDESPLKADEVALGISYDVIDDYLEGKEVPKEAKMLLESYYLKSMHKRHLPITIFDDFWK